MIAVDRRRVRGASTPVVMSSVAIIVLLAVAAWFLVIRPNREAVEANAPAKTHASPAAAASAKAAAPANVAAMSTDQLLSEARKALNEQRLLAPAGDNAFEFYLKVLERQPNNQVAQDALRETFPFGANAAEQAINQDDFAEAQREIALLAKADPDNYTLTILRSKLDAQRKVVAQQQQQAQTQAQAAQIAAAKKAQAEADAKAEAAQQAQQQALAEKQAEQQRESSAETPAENEASASARPKRVSVQKAVRVRSVSPRYPTAAVRNRQEGWVEVQWVVGTDGNTHSIRVLDAHPHHVFDRAAIDAVQRWKFKPELKNGKAVPVTLRQRIVFRLGGG